MPINAQNILTVWKHKYPNPISLAVLDCGMFTYEDPEDADLKFCDLKFCELISALGVLHQGGNIIIHHYILSSDLSIQSLYLLSTYFSSVFTIDQ